MFHMLTCNLSERFSDESKYFKYRFLTSASFLFSPLVPIKSLVCCVKSGFFAIQSDYINVKKLSYYGSKTPAENEMEWEAITQNKLSHIILSRLN